MDRELAQVRRTVAWGSLSQMRGPFSLDEPANDGALAWGHEIRFPHKGDHHMGIQDRDYYWEHRDIQEGRAKPGRPSHTPHAPQHEDAEPNQPGDGFTLIARGPRRPWVARNTRRAAPMWAIVCAIAFVILMAVFVMNLILRFLR